MSERNCLKRRNGKGFSWLGATLLVLVAGVIGLCFTGFPGKVKRGLREILSAPVAAEATDEADIYRRAEAELREELEEQYRREIEALRKSLDQAGRASQETPLQPKEIPLGTVSDVRNLRSGIPFKTEIDITKGRIASLERKDGESYTATYRLSLRVPVAAKTMQELETTSAGLGTILPGLPELVEKSQVSPWFNALYENKTMRVRRAAHSLNELLSKHNVYDCETILYCRAAGGRRVFLMQAEMDVVSDGSDGDRLPQMPESIVKSTHYQPFTSYGWKKRTPTPNPMVAGWESRIAAGQKELDDPATVPARKAWLRERIAYLKRGIADLKSRSFLIAEYDPFIVMPVSLLTSGDAFAPKVGDYAVVVHNHKVYPAIVGDGGPTFKVGEASLRLARELNPKATPYSRPVSDLAVTYLVFPGSRDPEKGPPDYVRWRQRCHELLGEIGGLGSGVELHTWVDLLPKPTPPEPPAQLTAPVTPATGGSAPSTIPGAPGSAEPGTPP